MDVTCVFKALLLLLPLLLLRGVARKKSLLLFAGTHIIPAINYTCIMSTSFTNLSLSLTQSHLQYKQSFSTSAWDAPCLSLNLFAEASEFFTPAAFQRRRPQNGVLGVYPQGSQKDGSPRALNRGRVFDSSSCLTETFQFVVSTSVSTHIDLNWLWRPIQEFH